jgi:hypothetical protein
MKHPKWFRAIGLVVITLMAVACICVLSAPRLRAQNPGQLTIKDPAEFNTYQMATSQADPKAKAMALESFLWAYPQSVVKNSVLDSLIDTYQGLQDADKTLSAASRLLQVDPSNMKAIFMSVLIKKSQCAKTQDAQTCDDAGALAQKGLTAVKPAATSDADWKKLISGTYPVFHSAIALDDIVSKKDIKAGISEYRTELMLYAPEQTTTWPSQGLWDTLQLAEAYSKSDSPDHLVQAVWFYARAWNYATPIKAQIEKKMNYYYQNYHGNLDGLDAVKTQAAATVFPPGTLENESAMPPGATPPAAPAQRQYEDVAPPPPPPAPAPTISMGQTKDQVTAAFGEPQRKAAAGPKEIFFYTDLKMKVTFTNGKVSSID